MSKKLLIVAGPTASGKTALGIELAKRLNGEIVSADSMQIYRGMDIGTAKATPEEQRQVKHHLLDILEPEEQYSVSRYVEDAGAVCEELFSRGKQPIVVGGTGLYIDSLLAGRRFAGEAEERAELRGALSEDYDRYGGEEMLRRLSEVDPERAEKLAATDRRRIIRALEVYALTGIPLSEHARRSREVPPPWDVLRIGIGGTPDPEAARDELLHTVACKAAIKAGWNTDPRERERIAEEVLSGRVKYCPHGRPVSVTVTRRDLDKLFKRIV